jgi:16S rRNA (guanine1207-N2)-methyltransferase
MYNSTRKGVNTVFTEQIGGIELTFETAHTLFSPDNIDKGTRAMLGCVRFLPGDKVLDLGCGYGVVGIYAAKHIGAENVVMSDNDETALAFTQKNIIHNNVEGAEVIRSDGFRSIPHSGFTLILSNPPYHADFSVPKHFIEKGFNRLQPGGKLYMVTKRLDWYKNKITAIFGGVRVIKTDGYFIFCAEKRGTQYANAKKMTKTPSPKTPSRQS